MSLSKTPTPHIEARPGEIAQTVLMPGDPLRAKFIAENILEDAVQYNSVRGMLGYTGSYKGKRLSVQGSGMGMPSMGIYSYELFSYYGVENIIRIGTAGAIDLSLRLRDIVFAMGSCYDSNYASGYNLKGSYSPIADYGLLETAVCEARRMGLTYKAGNVLSSDLFYNDDNEAMLKWQKMGVLAVEMECAALFMNAARLGKKALGILTVSDCIFTGEATTSAERQSAFTDMMSLAAEVAVKI